MAEYWKLVAESSAFHMTLSRAHLFQLEIPKIIGTFLSGKREPGMALRKLDFMPKSGNVDTYVKKGIRKHISYYFICRCGILVEWCPLFVLLVAVTP